jgi:tRNA threonylcarbamoyladenosine biosynthesis protein TsaE
MRLSNSAATEVAGQQIAAAISELKPEKFCIWLEGELGAGKTTFSRGFIHAMGHTGRVPSPTYTLVEPYALADYTIYHLDLYRLADAQELDFLGLDEYWDAGAVLLIEWPDRGAGFLPAADLLLSLAVAGEGRELDIQARTRAGEAVAQQAFNL